VYTCIDPINASRRNIANCST